MNNDLFCLSGVLNLDTPGMVHNGGCNIGFVDGHSKWLAARLNEAIRLAEGKFYVPMNGDDVCYPKCLELQLNIAATA